MLLSALDSAQKGWDELIGGGSCQQVLEIKAEAVHLCTYTCTRVLLVPGERRVSKLHCQLCAASAPNDLM